MGNPFRSGFVANANKDLIEDNIVNNFDTVDGVQSVSEAASHRTALVDDTLHAGTTEAPQRCPRCEPTSPPRRLQHEVASTEVSPFFPARQVRSGVPHGRCMDFRPRTKGVARVVGNIEPLVTIASPRICKLNTIYVVPEAGTGTCPQTERSIDMHPSPVLLSDTAYSPQVIELPGVHVAGLSTDNRRLRGTASEHTIESFGIHCAIRIRWYQLQCVLSKTQQPQRPIDRGMTLSTGHNPYTWRNMEAIATYIPTVITQHLQSRRSEPDSVCRLCPCFGARTRAGACRSSDAPVPTATPV
jgi:hypothetical protein